MPTRLPTFADVERRVQAVIDARTARAGSLRVLEAGCGRRSQFRYPPSARVTGVDVLVSQLLAHDGLQFRARGSVEALPLATGCFDLSVCWNVLEHVERPDAALRELARVTRPGGAIVIGIPNPWSVKGIAARATPWPVHVLVYRRALGDATAGTASFQQFPTRLSSCLAAPRFRAIAREIGIREVLFAPCDGPVPVHLRRRSPLAGRALDAINAVVGLITPRSWFAPASDFVAVFEK